MVKTIQGIRSTFVELLKSNSFVTDKSGVRTLEIVGETFVANSPTIFGQVNEDYVKKEIEWYHSMSRNVNDIPGGPPEIWKQVADKEGYINSNYGWCMYHGLNYDQYDNVVKTLKNNPNSRQAIAIYTRPSMHEDAYKNGMSDFMCTNTVQYLIRDGILHVVVNMRSNDVVFGYRNDYAWQRHVAEDIAYAVGLNDGFIRIIWQVGSLHIYERHFWMVEAYNQFLDAEMSKEEYMNRLHLYYR